MPKTLIVGDHVRRNSEAGRVSGVIIKKSRMIRSSKGIEDEPAFPGCVLTCRPLIVIEGEQGDKKDKERNDRIVAVEQDAHSWADIKPMDDLGKEFCRELEEFFVNDRRLSGKEYRVLGVKGPGQARKPVKSGMR